MSITKPLQLVIIPKPIITQQQVVSEIRVVCMKIKDNLCEWMNPNNIYIARKDMVIMQR